jgi:hypothetical protein
MTTNRDDDLEYDAAFVQPAALSPSLPRRAVAAITNNIVFVLGVAVIMVIAGSIILAWFDKVIPEAVVVMGGVALGYLGNAIQTQKTG